MNKVYLFQGLTFMVKRKGAKLEHKTTYKLGRFMVGASSFEEAQRKILEPNFKPIKWYMCEFKKDYIYRLVLVTEVREINANIS